MHALVLLMICAVMLTNNPVDRSALLGDFRFLPEVLSAIAVLIVVFVGAAQRFRDVRPGYWLAFAFVMLSIICSVIANSVETGPVLNGARYYLRAIPFFFLPAVVTFSGAQIGQQLRLVLLLAIAQVPIAIYQRWIVQSEGRWTGDDIFGTLQASSILSVFLISTVCLLAAFALRGRISKLAYIPLFFVLLIPTMINETKGTLFLLPIGLIIAFLVAAPRAERLRISILAMLMLGGFAAIFFPVYDMMNANKPYPTPLVELFTEEDALEGALAKTQELGSYEYEQPGRIDAVMVPLREIAHDPVKLVFGLGIGNASESSLGPQFTGAYFRRLGYFTFTSAGAFVAELGLLGTGLVFLLYWLIFRDAVYVARKDPSIIGTIAAGWCGVLGVMVAALFYKRLEPIESLSYLFWYVSGLIAATRMRAYASDAATSRMSRSGNRQASAGARASFGAT